MKKYTLFIGGDVYKAGNIGDDAILIGIIKILEGLDYNFSYIIGTLEGENIKLPISKEKYICIDSFNFYELIKAIKKSDFVIGGGGTLIGDELSLDFPLTYVARIISIAKIFGKPVYLFSIGANRLKTKEGKKIVKDIFSLSNLVVLRDQESQQVCKDYIQGEKLRVAADPAFIVSPKETKRTIRLKKRFQNKKFFGVNVINESWQKKKDYKIAIAKLCDYIDKKYNLTPVFFCNEVRKDEFFDYEASKNVISYMRQKSILLDPIYYSAGEMIDLISSFRFIFGMRMHALMFAALANVPFVTLSRIDKVSNFMNQFGLKASCTIENPSFEKLKKNVDKIMKERQGFLKHIGKHLKNLEKSAYKNSQYMESFIAENKNQLLNFNINLTSFSLLPKRELIRGLFNYQA